LLVTNRNASGKSAFQSSESLPLMTKKLPVIYLRFQISSGNFWNNNGGGRNADWQWLCGDEKLWKCRQAV